uniref:Vitellinogen open beta-sheet domain-containing protein n=1 Tax=Accipiter nisus TaxID=211598 RepID=A0A8B9N7B0_9AVES
MRTLGKFLGGNCTVQDSEQLSEMQLVLKAIGNAGLAAASLAPVLSLCASLKSNPIEIRLAAIQAFRRIPCSVRNAILVQLYQATNEDVEIRIAAYYIAMKCPHEELFKQVQKTLLKETSSQVGSFVWSHLSQLLETDDPLKEHLRDSIPDEILSRDFDRETWKYSSYSDVTFHSAGAGANMEASVVFSPASFLPRSVMTNLTVHLMGQAINLLEVDVRLENAEALMQKILGQKSATFSDYFFANTNERNHKSENPVETTGKVNQRKLTLKRYSPTDYLVTKSGKPKLRKANQNCPSRKYSKMSELVKKFTERTERKEVLKCELSMKIFGNELSFLDCEDLRKQMKHYSLNLAELAVKLLKGQEVQFNKRLSLATEELQFPAISGVPVQLAVNASAAINIKIKGNADFKEQSNFFLNGYIKPSAFVQLSAQMGTVGTLGQAGLSWLTGMRTSSSLDGGIQVKKGQELKVFLNTPEESMEIINFSSKLYFTVVDEMEDTDVFQDHTETRSCTGERVSEILGWQLCSEMSYPDPASGLVFPLTGPLRVAVTLTKQDRGLQQYVMEAACNYVPQENSWIPNEAVLHFFIGTPKSDLKRDVGVDLNFSVPQKKFRIRFIQPKKKIEIDGRIEFSKNSRIGHLELIVDDRDVYYIKGMTDLQMLNREQRYMTQLEVKLIKQSSPIILSGNITKQLGKKIAFSVSLNNLLKDAAFLSVFLEKKVDDKLRQYSLEGETHLPGVLGVHVISLLQQHEGLWSHGLRIKYGLLGEAKNLHHECSMQQKIKAETGAHGMYKLDIGHEFRCMWTPTYNHKVHLKHEASASWLSSQIEVNYGKHWDEINNKKKLLISQAFKNRSSSSLVNYFMEFTMQVLEKQVNYRTQLQHSHNSQVYLQSSTNFEVQYNDHMPFVAGLQWKDASRNGLKKWEGGLNIDTPWLYLYAAHKLHQPHHSTYLLTMELTTGKALSIKNLLVELFYKDQDNEKEGKVHIYTPATTYLQASTFNHLGRNVLHSYSEMISLWNQLVKNEIHLENNERAKFLCFKIKSTKQEFNFTASYQNLPMPKKTNFSLRTVWRDYKSLPVMLQFEGQIEELKKEKMLYQKCGTLHFRHPFKVPILQSFLLQETFTVDKKQKHYFLETKVLINGEEETVQTLRLGYQPENPYICAGLTHPYNYRLFPKDVEICILTQSHQNVKHELETTLKVNKEDVLSFLGGYQDKSSEADFRHLLHMDVTHSFQLEFPQAVGLSGELFSRQTKLEHFDYSVSVKAIINKNVSSQAQAALKSYGESNFNGSLYLHSNGRDMLMLEVDMNNENRKNARVVELRAFLHQIILTNPESVQFQLMGKIFPSRLLISSDVKLNENRLHMDFTGAREQKAGFVLSLNGRVHHTFVGLKTIPHLLSLSGLLKCKNNIHDGNINVMVNKTLYGLRLRNRNVFGNATVHNITFAMFQNGSQAIPMEAKLKGHLELSKEMKRGLASFQVDEKALSVDFSNIMSHGHSRVSGTFTHNISFLKNAGLPLDGILTAMCDHGRRNHTITIALQSGSERITAVFGGHRLSADPPKSQLSMSLKHNISKIKKHGIPFIVEAAGYYENFTRKIAAGITTTVEMEQLKIEIEKKTTGSAMEISLSLHHDVGGLTDIVPRVLEVACSGESANKQLSGLCNGAITFHHFETPARVSVNGSMFTSNFTVVFFGHVSFHDMFAWLQLHATTNIQPHLEIAFQHSLPLLQSLGIARENQVKVSAMRSEKYKVMLGIVLGPCSLKADGEVSLASNETDTEWVLTFRNKCVSLEDLSIPNQSRLTGSIQKDKCQAELLCVLEAEGKTAHLEVRTECKPKITLEIHFKHDLPQLKEIPRENKLSITAQNQLKYHVRIGMKLGDCELQMNGDFDPEKKLQWKMFLENKCQTIQDLGAPLKIDGSGYVLMDKMNLESQTLISVDESKLQGLIILKVTDERQELDAVLTHNIQGAADIGIPMRMLVDVISEKTSDCYKRLINFCVNSKQVTEELSFVQKLDVLSLNYQFTHNIEALKTLQIKDRIELQAILNLKVIKSFSMKVHYGAHLTVLKGQIQEFETNTNITGNFHHNWPWLLQARVPPSLQIDVVFQGRNTTRERYVHIAAGETSIIYIINSYYVGHQVDIFCQSIHSSEALQAFGYPKAINLILSLQKSETKAKTICEIQYDDKDITVTMDVDTDFQLCGKFEFMAEVKHSISFFHHLGLPFFLKVTIQEVLTENETEGALRLTYEQNTNFSFTISRKKDQQGEELNIKALQTHPVFLQYFPGAAELSSKVNYDMSEAKGKLYLSMEKRDFNVTAKLTFTGTSYNNVIEIIQTMSQLKILPRQLVFMTVYQKGNRTRMLRHIALWDGKEIKLTGTYTGLFPKLPGGHDVQVELFHPLSIPFPWHARVNLYVKHSARSHRDDLTVIWNENDQISVSSSLKFGKDRMNYRATVAHPFNYTLKQLEVHSLSERRGRKYNQQLQLAGNGGQPADIRLTLEDKSKVNITAWDGCMTLSSGQLQRVLSMEHLHACGSLEQRSALFNEYLDLNWDDKKFKHNLTYEVGEGSCIC